MSEHESSTINVGHTLEDEEKKHDETKNFNRNDILIKETNAFARNQYKLENSSCIYSTETKMSESISLGFVSNNSEMTSTITGSLNKELINDQLIVLEPNNPAMVRFQNALKKHLLKQKENIKEELLTLDGLIRLKQNKKSSLINEINNATCRIESQHSLLNEFHKMKIKLESAKEQVEKSTNQGKERHTEIITKITVEIKKISVLKRHLDNGHGLLKELKKYEKEQEITFNMCHQKKSQTKQYKKKLLNEQQKKDLLLLSLTQEIIRLEDRMKQLGEQAETKYNERELLKQKVMDNSTDLDSLNSDNAKIGLLWNGVLISIQQRDKNFEDIKNEFQEAKNKYQTLLLETNSYKRSVHEEFQKNEDLNNLFNKLKREQKALQNTLKTCLDKFNNLKDDYSKLKQITEFQSQNLDQILFEQKSLKNEINMLLHTFNIKSNQKLKHEEDILDELKKQLFTNKYCVQINNKISELKVLNKEHELVLVEVENNLSRVSLKLEQSRTTSYNMEKDIEENTKYLNSQELVLSTVDSELKKIFTEIHIKSRQIDLESKHLDRVKNKQEKGCALTPQMQIDQLQFKIDEVQNEIDSIKQLWVLNQNKNVKLLDQCNKQLNELNKVRKYVLIMDTKNVKIKQEIISLLKEDDQYKRTLTNMRNTISKLNDNFSKNKGKSSQLLNENEWIQCSYIAELKENENQCLKQMDQLKHLKNELNEIKSIYIEKQRESNSWNTKVQFLIEIKKEMKNKEGDSGDIEVMKNEIHRMQIRESQLKKNLESIMLDLEVCISRREIIYNTVAAKNTRLKGKNETKQKFLKKLNDLRMNIKKVKIDCKKLDQMMSNLQHYKMELESNFTCLRNKLMQIKKDIDDLDTNIDDNNFAKIKNVLNLSYKQCYAKFLDEVKKGKYRLMIKNESKMSEELAVEWKKNSDLISIVEALKNDFPDLEFYIARLLCMLKSINC